MFNWTLKQAQGNNLGPPILLPSDNSFMFGRKPGAFIRLDSSFASRKHCTINIRHNGAYIIDHKTLNGTYIGNDKVPSEREIPLRTGDAIGIGLPANEFSSQPYFIIYKADLEPEFFEMPETCEVDATLPYMGEKITALRNSNNEECFLNGGYDLVSKDSDFFKVPPSNHRSLSLSKIKRGNGSSLSTNLVQPLTNRVNNVLKSLSPEVKSSLFTPENIKIIFEGSPFSVDNKTNIHSKTNSIESNPASVSVCVDLTESSQQLPSANYKSVDGSDSSLIELSPSPPPLIELHEDKKEYSVCDDIIVIDSDVDEDDLPCSQFFTSIKKEASTEAYPNRSARKSLEDIDLLAADTSMIMEIINEELDENNQKTSGSCLTGSPTSSDLFIHSQLSPETYLNRVGNHNDEDMFSKITENDNLLEALMTQIETDTFKDLSFIDTHEEFRPEEEKSIVPPSRHSSPNDKRDQSSFKALNVKPSSPSNDSTSVTNAINKNENTLKSDALKKSAKRRKEANYCDNTDEPKNKTSRISRRTSDFKNSLKLDKDVPLKPERPIKKTSRGNSSFSSNQIKIIVEAGKKLEGSITSRQHLKKRDKEPYSLRPSEKKKIKQMRKKKLQEVALAEKSKRNSEESPNENSKNLNSDKCFVKNTDVNRGAILIDMIPQRSSSRIRSKDNKKTASKTDVKPKKDAVETAKLFQNTLNKSKSIDSETSKENENCRRKISDPEKTLRRSSLRNKNSNDVKSSKEAVNERLNHKGNRSSDTNTKVDQIAIKKKGSFEAPVKRRSILKSGESLITPRKSVQFESSQKLTLIRYFEKEDADGKKNGTFHPNHASTVYLKGSPKTADSLIRLFCKWNSKWIEESLHTDDLPPLLQPEFPNPSPVVASYESYREYQNTLLPLQVFELWESIVREVHHKKRTVCVGGVRSSNESRDRMMEDISIISYAQDGEEMLKQGDFVIVKGVDRSEKSCVYHMNTRRGKAEAADGQNKTNLWLSFGYVAVQPIRKPLQNSDLESINQFKTLCANGSFNKKKSGQIYTVNFQVLVRAKTIKFWRPGIEISLVPCVNLLGELKLFQALERLIFSPLGPLVLSPHSVLSIENSQDYPFKQQQFLNTEQKNAVNYCTHMVLGAQPSIALIHGPPGTGKSVVITYLVLTILDELRKDQHKMRILICAPSNFAIDQLVSRLLFIRKKLDKNKFNMVRVGNYDMMSEESKQISLRTLAERMLEKFSHPKQAKAEIEKLKKREKYLKSLIESGSSDQSNLEQEVNDTKRYMRELQLFTERKADRGMRGTLLRRYEREILLKADIVATTLSSSVCNTIQQHLGCRENKPFGCCIVDEATQATELQTLVPTLLNVDKFVLVGDDKQLSPVVLSQKAKAEGLEVSLFERVLGCWKSRESNNAPVFHLTRQYRMHREISSFPSRCFYSGSLISERPLTCPGAPPLHPYLVLSHSFLQQSDGNSNVEEGELAAQIVSVVKAQKDCKSLSIGIITPYQNQKDLIIRTLKNYKLENEVSVMTVDGAQGQERDVILLSCVRSQGVGFMSDCRRLNVALTRARHALLLLANFNSLRETQIWRDLLSDATARKLVIETNKVLSKNTLKKMLFQFT